MEFENKIMCEWLEESIKTIMESETDRICICAILPSDGVFTGYYNCDVADKGAVPPRRGRNLWI